MSYVTNVILNLGLENYDRLDDVNAFFDNQRGFVSLEHDSLPAGWYGGNKSLEVELSVGAFNYLDLDGLVDHICGLGLGYPEDVQLLVCGQEEERFRIVGIIH